MRQGIHCSFTPFWRWLCLIYVCLGVTTMTGHVHLGTWLPGVVPETVWGLVWLVCAVGTWQGGYVSVRGSLSILAPALSTISYAIDFLLDQLIPPPLLDEGPATLALCVMWGSVCALIHTITRLDQPRS